MEPTETPPIQDINILTSENTKSQNNNFDAKQYFLEPENNEENNEQEQIIIKAPTCCGICCIVFFILVMIAAPIQLIIEFLDNSKILFIILPIGIIILFGFFIILILMKCSKKYVFSRNIKKNKFYVEKYNYLNNQTMELELSLGNYYIQCTEEKGKVTHDNGSPFYYVYKIYLYNQFNDTSEINLDSTKIKEVPAKFSYVFEISSSGLNQVKLLEERLNKFIFTKIFKNPLKFNIFDYMKKEKDPSCSSFIPSFLIKVKYIKFSDYFFTFYFKSDFGGTGDAHGALRIDFIYSEDFDRIFIGVVEKYEKSYIKTFEFRMDIIDKFVLQKFKNYGNGFDLKVMFKDKQIQEIWTIENKSQKDLEGLVYLLNERLNKETHNI